MNQLFYGDNLDLIKKLAGESVDLIYLDPPFNSNRGYNYLYSQATGLPLPEEAEAFYDAWDYDLAKEEAIANMKEFIIERTTLPKNFLDFLDGLIVILKNTDLKMFSYIIFMTERLLAMHHVLKSTGSIYLHCDPTASHYLKIVLDGIFGRKNFRSEIIWKRTSAHNDAKKWGAVHDVIFFYVKDKSKYYWNGIYTPYSKEYLEGFYKHQDDKGGFSLGDLSQHSIGKGYHYEYKGYKPPVNGWRMPLETMEKWDGEGLIYFPKDATQRLRFKRYLSQMKGVPAQDVITDIYPLQGGSKEKLGYPTQKPKALLDRIIEGSCPKGGTVLDPFCGCGTTVISAQSMERKWIGMDICLLAIKGVEKRIQEMYALKNGKDYEIAGMPKTLEQAVMLANNDGKTRNEGRFQFQFWAVDMVEGFASTKKSGDGGIDGAIYFWTEHEKKHLSQMILSVKSDKTINQSHLRELIGTLTKTQNALMAGLITLYPVSKAIQEEALKQGFFTIDDEIFGVKKYQKVQILSAGELLNAKKFDVPHFKIQQKKAEITEKRAVKYKINSLSLFDED